MKRKSRGVSTHHALKACRDHPIVWTCASQKQALEKKDREKGENLDNVDKTSSASDWALILQAGILGL